MPLAPDVQNFLTVVVYNNLANLSGPNPVLVVPPGFENFFNTEVVNSFQFLGLPPDIQQIVNTAVTSNRLVITTS